MKGTQKRQFLIDRFKANYSNKSSKWFKSDVADFSAEIDNASDARIEEMYSNAVAFDSPEFEAKVAKEEKKMFKEYIGKPRQQFVMFQKVRVGLRGYGEPSMLFRPATNYGVSGGITNEAC